MAREIAHHMRQSASVIRAVAGRSFEEQVEYIKREGNYALPNDLRGRLFEYQALGIDPPRDRAETCIIFGCYFPMMLPLSVRNYLRLLNRVGIEFTFLKKEYCCGEFLVMTAKSEEEMARAKQASREFISMNISLAQDVGACNIAYFCTRCAYLAKEAFPASPVRQIHYPDIIMDQLQKQQLRIEPAAVGYYRGCQARNRTEVPGVELDFKGYRDVLNRIEGLTVIDLPLQCCCLDNPNGVLETAERLNLRAIVTACVSCQIRLARISRGRVRVVYFPDLLLHALDGERI